MCLLSYLEESTDEAENTQTRAGKITCESLEGIENGGERCS